jgi:hypothetical protein
MTSSAANPSSSRPLAHADRIERRCKQGNLDLAVRCGATEYRRDREGAWRSTTGSRRSSNLPESAGTDLPQRESAGFERCGSRRGGLDLATWRLAPAVKRREGQCRRSGKGPRRPAGEMATGKGAWRRPDEKGMLRNIPCASSLALV